MYSFCRSAIIWSTTPNWLGVLDPLLDTGPWDLRRNIAFLSKLCVTTTALKTCLCHWLRNTSSWCHTTNASIVPVKILKTEISQTIEQLFPGTTEVHLTTCVTSSGVNYWKDMNVPYGSTSGLPDFAEILHICICRDQLHFIVHRLSGWYNEHFRSYELRASPSRETVLILLYELLDIYPLADYRVGSYRMVTLKRHKNI